MRINRVVIGLVGIGAVASLAACSSGSGGSQESESANPSASSASATATTPATKTINSVPNTAELKVGETLDVVLESNASTGYHWKVTTDTSNIATASEAVYAAGATSMPGAPGTATTRVTAVAPGTAVIRFQYVPPGNQTPTNSPQDLTVTVTQ